MGIHSLDSEDPNSNYTLWCKQVWLVRLWYYRSSVWARFKWVVLSWSHLGLLMWQLSTGNSAEIAWSRTASLIWLEVNVGSQLGFSFSPHGLSLPRILALASFHSNTKSPGKQDRKLQDLEFPQLRTPTNVSLVTFKVSHKFGSHSGW